MIWAVQSQDKQSLFYSILLISNSAVLGQATRRRAFLPSHWDFPCLSSEWVFMPRSNVSSPKFTTRLSFVIANTGNREAKKKTRWLQITQRLKPHLLFSKQGSHLWQLFILQIINVTHLHGIQFTADLHNWCKFLKFPSSWQPSTNRGKNRNIYW